MLGMPLFLVIFILLNGKLLNSYKCDEDTNENCTDCGDYANNHRISNTNKCICDVIFFFTTF